MASGADTQQKLKARGLPSIQQAREARSQGKSRMPSPKFWAYCALVLATGGILRWKWTQGEIEGTRQKLLADQRGVASSLGPRWFPLQRRIEGWTTALAKDGVGEVVERDVLSKWDFRSRPGIYLRLPLTEGLTAEGIRRGARDSLRDGFTACLMRMANPNATAGRECKRTRECPAREVCNEQDHCSRPAQPFNLRVAYRTMHILSDDWVRDVRTADSELRLRLYVANYDDAIRDDMPIAAEFLTQAQYFLLVLDETPDSLKLPDGGSLAEAVQGTPHFARVGVFRLSDDKPLLRIRRESRGELIGAAPVTDIGTGAAIRQANSCALALAVRDAMDDLPGIRPAQ